MLLWLSRPLQKAVKTNNIVAELSEFQALSILRDENEPVNVAILDKEKLLIAGFLLSALSEDQDTLRVLFGEGQ